jgi:hypothetical protein
MTAAEPLNIDSPHSRGYTAKIGSQPAEAVRVLNHAAVPGKEGLRTQEDAYRLIGDLYTAAGRFPQPFRQIARHLTSLDDTNGSATSKPQPSLQGARAVMRMNDAPIIAEQAGHSAGSTERNRRTDTEPPCAASTSSLRTGQASRSAAASPDPTSSNCHAPGCVQAAQTNHSGNPVCADRPSANC